MEWLWEGLGFAVEGVGVGWKILQWTGQVLEMLLQGFEMCSEGPN